MSKYEKIRMINSLGNFLFMKSISTFGEARFGCLCWLDVVEVSLTVTFSMSCCLNLCCCWNLSSMPLRSFFFLSPPSRLSPVSRIKDFILFRFFFCFRCFLFIQIPTLDKLQLFNIFRDNTLSS